MSDTPKHTPGTATAAAPTVKVEVTTPAPHPTPESDAKAAKADRDAQEKKAQAEFDQLEKDGKIAEPGAPLVSYESARASLTAPKEDK